MYIQTINISPSLQSFSLTPSVQPSIPSPVRGHCLQRVALLSRAIRGLRYGQAPPLFWRANTHRITISPVSVANKYACVRMDESLGEAALLVVSGFARIIRKNCENEEGDMKHAEKVLVPLLSASCFAIALLIPHLLDCRQPATRLQRLPPYSRPVVRASVEGVIMFWRAGATQPADALCSPCPAGTFSAAAGQNPPQREITHDHAAGRGRVSYAGRGGWVGLES